MGSDYFLKKCITTFVAQPSLVCVGEDMNYVYTTLHIFVYIVHVLPPPTH